MPSDVVAMEWGYDEGHPFDENCKKLADAGVSFFACPGTSSWSSLAGRTANCIQNIREACDAANRHGGLGMLVRKTIFHAASPIGGSPPLLFQRQFTP